jgi:protein N-lysine methyltransferase METTL21A
MERNILLNRLQSTVVAAELDWYVPPSKRACRSMLTLNFFRAKPPPKLPRPDIILAADCVYFEPAFPLLVSTLSALVPPPPAIAPEVLFCYKKRRKADKRFFSLLKKSFAWSSVRG